MLYKASITREVVDDEDLLVEQLYIFLNDFVNHKLKYETYDNRDDCKQDAILYLLDKARKLTDEQKDILNLEQYFYNRANTYVSTTWLKQLKRYQSTFVSESKISKYIDISSQFSSGLMLSVINTNNQLLCGASSPDIIDHYIDYDILLDVYKEYQFIDICYKNIIIALAEKELNKLGVKGNNYKDTDTRKVLNDLRIIAHTIVDEYIIILREGVKDC